MPNATISIADHQALIGEIDDVTTVTSSNPDVLTVIENALKDKISANIYRRSDDTLSMGQDETVVGGSSGRRSPSVGYVTEVCTQLAKEIPDAETLQARVEPIKRANSLQRTAAEASSEGRAYAYARRITKYYADAAIACLQKNGQAPNRDLAEKIRDAIAIAHLNPKVDKTPGA